ncbi:MAG: nucleotide sugar dehydrogenase [Actinomycetota bacterium]
MSERVDLVIIGLGYVGLPLAAEAAGAGLRVVGLDLNESVVEELNGGRSHIDDLTDADVGTMIENGFRATIDPAVLASADAVVVCVPTPLDDSGSPDLAAVRGASATIASHLQAGQLVVLESTTYPGTTNDIVRPLLEVSGLTAGDDFHLAYSPERVDPGNATYGIRNTPKVVGGYNAASTDSACALYKRFIETVVPVGGTREAEMAKLLENTYRHINIALVNEMAIFCHDLGIDLWESIEAAKTKPFGFQAFYPGPGVGGHCIPIDPNYLSYKVRTLGYPFRFVELAQEISGRMPSYVVNRITHNLNEAQKSVKGAKILLLGVTYKPDIADERESPAQPLARRLLDLGADLRYHDPLVMTWDVDGTDVPRVDDLMAEAETADLTVLLQNHKSYDLEALAARARRVFDTRGSMEGSAVERM